MNQSQQVVIVGGGIAGISAAARLSQAGLPVILFESRSLGEKASTKNQGWLHSGGLFALNDPELARNCLKAMKITEEFCPACIDSHTGQVGSHPMPRQPAATASAAGQSIRHGMFYLFSKADAPIRAWMEAWARVGIPFQNVGRQEFLNAVPSANPKRIHHAFLLPDQSFSPDILLEELAAMAQNAGTEIRTDTPIREILTEKNRVVGVVTKSGEVIHAGQVVLAAGHSNLSELLQVADHLWYSQPSVECHAIKTHVLSVKPDLTQQRFVLIDQHGLNHIPHFETSVFESGKWIPTRDPQDEKIDTTAMDELKDQVHALFPEFDSENAFTHEWAATSIHPMGVDQIHPGQCPRPAVIDHGSEGGLENLWSIYPGRATLWSVMAEDLRQRMLTRLQRHATQAASPPWSTSSQKL